MIPFEKYHGTGNDFVVVDAARHVPDRSAFARAVCDEDRGLGVDGVLFLDLDDGTPPRVGMSLFQPDGGTAAMCGNGARCVATWAGRHADAETVLIDTPSGTRRAEFRDDGVEIEMGEPTFDPDSVPLAASEPLIEERVEGFDVTAVNTGVPHAVAFVDDVDEVPLAEVAPAIRHADVFPEGANVNLAAERDGGFDQRTFERGVEGETLSCGTGAVAIAAVAKRLGRIDGGPVTIRPPGGELVVTVPDEGPATLRGPVVREFSGEVSPVEPYVLDRVDP